MFPSILNTLVVLITTNFNPCFDLVLVSSAHDTHVDRFFRVKSAMLGSPLKSRPSFSMAVSVLEFLADCTRVKLLVV